MRGRSLPDMLLYEAKRKPAVAALVDRVTVLTDAEIDAASVPLPWFRIALKQLRDQRNEKALFDRVRALITPHIVDGIVPDPSGQMLCWHGGTTFLQINQRSSIEVRYGHLIWLPDDGGVWIETIFTREIDPKIIPNSKPVATVTKSGYAEACRERRCRG